MDYPTGCELRELTVLGHEDEDLWLATTCADEDNFNEGYIYEYYLTPVMPVYDPDSEEVREAREMYLALEGDWFDGGWDGKRKVITGSPLLFISDIKVNGIVKPGNSIDIEFDVSDDGEWDYLALNTLYTKNFAGAKVSSLDGSYDEELPLQQINFFEFGNYFFSIFNDNQRRTITLDWEIPTDAIGEYFIEVYTKQCVPHTMVCGDKLFKKNVTVTVEGMSMLPDLPEPPRLYYPLDGSRQSSAFQRYLWYAMDDAIAYAVNVYDSSSSLKYRLSLGPEKCVASGSRGKFCYTYTRTILPSGTYSWNVVGTHTSGAEIESKEWKFLI